MHTLTRNPDTLTITSVTPGASARVTFTALHDETTVTGNALAAVTQWALALLFDDMAAALTISDPAGAAGYQAKADAAREAYFALTSQPAAGTLADLIARVRIDLDDTVAPYLWGNEELTSYINRAMDEACLRARLIVDSTTVSVCRIAVVAGTAEYTLDPRVHFVLRAILASQQSPLEKTGRGEMDRLSWDWESDTGTPEYFMQDMGAGKVRLYPIPEAADTLKMTVSRAQLTPFIWASHQAVQPEIPAIHHNDLLEYVKFAAWSKQDAEAADPSRAAQSYQLFEAAFGEKPTAREVEARRVQYTKRVRARFM